MILFNFLALSALLWKTGCASGVKNLVVFGDSYADVGNLRRLSNGPYWSENLAVGWNTSLYSFAFDGAVCNNSMFNVSNPMPSLVDQIEMYYNQQLNLDPNETVYGIWVGLNDIEQGIRAKGADFAWGDIVSCISKQIRNIRKVFNSNRFLVLNAPPVDLMPYFAGSNLAESRKDAAARFNELLSKDIISLNKHHRALELDLVDINTMLTDIVATPGEFGFKDATNAYWDACQGQCEENIDEFVWWDKVHLTGGAHRAIANSILLSGSMEPPMILVSPEQVQTMIKTQSYFKSPKYAPKANTGLIEKKVAEIMAAKKTEKPTVDSVDDDVVEDTSSNHVYFVLMVFVVLCIVFVWFTRRQKLAVGLAALSNLVKGKNNGGRGRFLPLRNMDSNV